MRTFFVGLLCLVLPESHREGLVWEYGVHAPLWSFLFGIVELVVGLLLLMDQGFGYAREFVSAPTGWLSFYMTPTAWFLALVTITGVVRMASYLSNSAAVGEPWAWAAIRAYEAIRGHSHRRRETREFAPLHLPDRALIDDGERLVIISPRRKADWDELVTIKVGEDFYQLVEVEERYHGSWRIVAHILEEIGENEPIRRLLHAEVEFPGESSSNQE